MSAIITIENFGASNLKEQTYVDDDAITGASGIVVKSAQGIANDYFALVGNPASESAEILAINNVSGESVSFATSLQHDHPKYDNIAILYCNQLRIYRAPNTDGTPPADDQYIQIDAIDIDPDQPDSTYVDPAGSSDFWYKFTYYNNISLSETDRSTAEAVRGGGVTDYCSISDIRDEAGLSTNRFISDSKIARKRLEAQAEVDSTLAGIYTIPFQSPINALIDSLTCKLAAGFLLVKNYGSLSSMTTNNGKAKIDDARALLMELKNRQKTLVSNQGVDQSLSTGVAFSMYPNPSSTESDGTGDRFFRTSDVQGYENRRY